MLESIVFGEINVGSDEENNEEEIEKQTNNKGVMSDNDSSGMQSWA